MPFKLTIADKGKAWKVESTSEILVGKKIGETIKGADVGTDLEGYELEITGGSDSSGFPHKKDVEGSELKRVLLTKGWGMWQKPRKLGKKKVSTPDGLRLRKTVRGNRISEKTIQINMRVVKHGHKKFEDLFPDQNKPKAPKAEAVPAA